MSQQTPSVNELPQTRPGKKNEKAPSLMVPIFKLPVLLYRLGLGWLLGNRFMQITHVGRHQRLVVGIVAVIASLLVTAAYHWGYPEYSGSKLFAPVVGNGVMSLAYLLTTNPLGAILSHIAMHVSAVLHGINTAVQLPPHY